jgi:NTE family protein
MPFGTEPREKGVGLALSGGGFRATLFHLGALWRLNELGWLPKLDRISSVSGGSITSGLLAVRWTGLQFVEDVAENFVTIIVDPLRRFCERDIDLGAIAEGALLPFRSIADEVQERYEDHLFGEMTLNQLPDRPRFVFMATNLATGASFRFSKPYAGDYHIGLISNPTFRVSLAVTASSAFPPVLSPVTIKTDPDSFVKVEGADLFDQLSYRRKLMLTDGGAYDNLGLESIWNRYNTVLVSDAGAPFNTDSAIETGPIRQAMRALSIATDQSRGLRKRALVGDFETGKRMGTYWGIDTSINDYDLPDSLKCSDSRTNALAAIRTRLNRFSESEQCELINWGYAVCDAAIRKYVLIDRPNLPEPHWPYPYYDLNRG